MKQCIFFVFLFFILYSLFFIRPVYAITETDADLQVTYDEPMFPSTIVWYPGLTIAKSFSVKNLGGGTHTTSLKAENTSQTGSIADNLYFRVDEGVTNRYGGANDKTMKNFWDNGETNLSDIGSGSTTSYTVTVNMPGALGNEFQGKGARFNLDVGFIGTESKVTVSNAKAVTGIMITPTVSFITTTVTPEFVQNVLGIATPSAALEPTGEIKGEKTQVLGQRKWIIIFLVTVSAIVLLRIFFLARKNG